MATMASGHVLLIIEKPYTPWEPMDTASSHLGLRFRLWLTMAIARPVTAWPCHRTSRRAIAGPVEAWPCHCMAVPLHALPPDGLSPDGLSLHGLQQHWAAHQDARTRASLVTSVPTAVRTGRASVL